MKPYDRVLTLTFAFIVGLFVGVFLFGQLVHEESHALAAWLFKVPFVYSSTHVDTIPLTGIPNLSIGLAGGFGEAIVGSLFFWLMTLIEKQKGRWFWGAVGFEIAFLALVFTGITNAIWEGIFNQSYKLNFNNSTAILILFVSMLILSSFVINRQKKVWKKIFLSSSSDDSLD